MTDEEILKKIAGIEGLGGMTVNERLYLSGVLEEFDHCKTYNKVRAKQLLLWLDIDEPSIELILNMT